MIIVTVAGQLLDCTKSQEKSNTKAKDQAEKRCDVFAHRFLRFAQIIYMNYKKSSVDIGVICEQPKGEQTRKHQ